MQVENHTMKNKYTKIKLLLISIGILFSVFVYSQNSVQLDSVFLNFIPGKGLSFGYIVESGNTIYGISKKFNVRTDEIYSFNYGLNKKPLSTGTEILIPLNKELLVTDYYKKNSKKTKVFYKVGPKETLFRVAKVYLGMEINELMKLNKLRNSKLDLDQLLYVGYLDPNGSAEEVANDMLPYSQKKVNTPKIKNKIEKSEEDSEKTYRKVLASNISPPDNEVRKEKPAKGRKSKSDKEYVEKMEYVGVISRPVSVSDQPEKENRDQILKFHNDSGVALWNKESRVKGVYVLSNDAALNSMIEINNPMVQRKIFAKVIGNIPPNTYPDNVKVVLSPEAALTLGALDSRFFVRLHYLK